MNDTLDLKTPLTEAQEQTAVLQLRVQAKQAAADLYDVFHSWRTVGGIYGKSGAYAYRLAHDPQFLPSAEAAEQWAAFVRGTRNLKFLAVRVYALEELPPGTIILGTPRQCVECHNWYVFPHPAMKTCSRECKLARRRRLAKERKEKERSDDAESPAQSTSNTGKDHTAS